MTTVRVTQHSLPLRLLLGLAVAALALAACGDDDDASGPEVSDAWARTSAMSQANGAVYLTISGGDTADRLVGAAAPTEVAATTEIHETVAADMTESDMAESDMADGDMAESDMTESDMAESDMAGAMTMQPVDAIDVPAGATVALEPGGYHIMLLDLTAPLEDGQTFDLVLRFETAGELTVPVEVREG